MIGKAVALQISSNEVNPLRSRWMNPTIGRFTSFDDFEASSDDPQHLHKYAYGGDDPVNNCDPSGQDWSLVEQTFVTSIRFTSFAMNVYGFGSNTIAAFRDTRAVIDQFQRGHIVEAIATAASAAFHGGMAALSLLGLKSFIGTPPSLSGGLSSSLSGGSIQIALEELAIRNPAAIKWITQELAPALIAIFNSSAQLNLFGEPSGRSNSGKTNGVLDSGNGEFPEFPSGENGPAKQFWGQPGFTAVSRTHTEAHAAAYMRLKNIKFAVLRINNANICDACRTNLKYMLGPGRRLIVVDGTGKTETFVGE